MRRFGMHANLFAAMALLAAGIAVAGTPKPAASQVAASKQGACERWEVFADCHVSWYRLLANPAAYRGRIVGVTGYLVSDFGDLILYPDKASYQRGNEDDGLILQRPFSISKRIVDKAAHGAFPVYVLGRLGSPIEGNVHVIPRVGSLYEIHKILDTPRIPSGTPLEMDGIHIQPDD